MAKVTDIATKYVPGLVETSPQGDIFGAKVHEETCVHARRAVFVSRLTKERARKISPCLVCKPDVP